MVLITTNVGTPSHTGSTLQGPVAGTLTEGANTFVTVEGVPVMVADGDMDIPSHWYATGPGPAFTHLFHSHSFSPDTLQNNYVTVESNPIVLVGDNYAGDITTIDDAGQSFVQVE